MKRSHRKLANDLLVLAFIAVTVALAGLAFFMLDFFSTVLSNRPSY